MKHTVNFEVEIERIGGPVRGHDRHTVVTTNAAGESYDPVYEDEYGSLIEGDWPFFVGDVDEWGCEGAGHYTGTKLNRGEYRLTIERIK